MILQRCFLGLRLLKFLVWALEKVVLGAQCLVGEGRTVQVVLRAVAKRFFRYRIRGRLPP